MLEERKDKRETTMKLRPIETTDFPLIVKKYVDVFGMKHMILLTSMNTFKIFTQ